MNKFNAGASTNFLQMVTDVITGVIALGILMFIEKSSIQGKELPGYCAMYAVFMLVYILMNKDNKVYNVTTFYYFDRIFKQVTKAFIMAALVITAILYYVSDSNVNKKFFVLFLAMEYVFLLIETYTYRKIYKKNMKNFFLRTAYVGEKSQFNRFEYYMDKTNIGINLIGFIRANTKKKTKGYLGNVNDLENIIHRYSIDQIYIMQDGTEDKDMQRYIDLCMEIGVTVRVVMDYYDEGNAKSYMSSVGTYPVVTYHTVSLNDTEKSIKRGFDILGALFGIILFSPIMLVTAVLIKTTSEGPAIFKQTRVGMNGRKFSIYKFRTMYIDAEERKKELMELNEMEGGCIFKIKDDPRITGIGKILRKTSIDELPQFFNVLFGSMSLVGTRPPTEDEVNNYDRNHWRRISIKPGITGAWQVNGRNSITSFDKIVELDTKYIDEWSLLLDIKMIIKTVIVLLKKDGAY